MVIVKPTNCWMFFRVHPSVLPALVIAIFKFGIPDFQGLAVSAMINIMRNYPRRTLYYLRQTLGTLLKTHASSQERLEASFPWHEINKSKILLIQFRVELATYINDPDRLVRWVAIKAFGQLSAALDPDLHWYIPALALAICDDVDPDVRLAAIDAARQLLSDMAPGLQLEYCHLVLRALGLAICDFEYRQVQDHAASAMINIINISMNYPLVTKTKLRKTLEVTVRTLEEELASSQERLELALEDIALEDIASERNLISASESLLVKFESELPHDTWDSILTPSQQNKAVRLFAKLSTDMLPALAKAICDHPDQDVQLAAIDAAVQLPFVRPNLAQAIYDFENPEFQAHAASAMVNISKNYPPDTLKPYLLEIVGTLLEFRCREGIASNQTRILAIENLLKQFRDKLPPDTWTSTWSSLLKNQQMEFLNIVAHR